MGNTGFAVSGRSADTVKESGGVRPYPVFDDGASVGLARDTVERSASPLTRVCIAIPEVGES
jgi:hypothetical protein